MACRAGLGAGQARPGRGDLGAGATRGDGARPGAGRARAGRRGEGSRGIGLSPPLQGSWAARRDGADDGETGTRATWTRHSGGFRPRRGHKRGGSGAEASGTRRGGVEWRRWRRGRRGEAMRRGRAASGRPGRAPDSVRVEGAGAMRERCRRRGRVTTGPGDPTGKRTRRCSGEAEAGRGGDGVRGGVREWSGGGGVVGGSGGRRRARSGARDAPIQIRSGGKGERSGGRVGVTG